jgi:hypothetical protein
MDILRVSLRALSGVTYPARDERCFARLKPSPPMQRLLDGLLARLSRFTRSAVALHTVKCSEAHTRRIVRVRQLLRAATDHPTPGSVRPMRDDRNDGGETASNYDRRRACRYGRSGIGLLTDVNVRERFDALWRVEVKGNGREAA